MKNKGGRPKVSAAKALCKTISTRLTRVEWLAVRGKIQRSGLKRAEYMRQALLKSEVKAARTQEDREQCRGLIGMANNLNQLTRLAHSQGLPSVEENLRNLMTQIKEILRKNDR